MGPIIDNNVGIRIKGKYYKFTIFAFYFLYFFYCACGGGGGFESKHGVT